MAKQQKATKEELLRLIAEWPNHSISEMAAMLGRPKYWISDMSAKIRKNGVDLPKKYNKGDGGYLKALMQEVIAEMNNQK